MADYGQAIADVMTELAGSANFPVPVTAFGHSLGALAVYEAVRAGAGFEGVVLAMPLARTKGWPALRFASGIAGLFSDSVPDGSGGSISLRWFRALAYWNNDLPHAPRSRIPALVILGGKDKVIDRNVAISTYAMLFTASRFIVVPGAGHHEPERASSSAFYANVIGDFTNQLSRP